MDNNKTPVNPIPPQPTTPPAPTPQQPVLPTPQPAPVQQPPQAKVGSHKGIMWLVGGLIIGVLALGGIYLFLNSKQAANKQSTQTDNTTTPSAIPSAQSESLDQQLNSVNVEATDSGFTSVDSDLSNL